MERGRNKLRIKYSQAERFRSRLEMDFESEDFSLFSFIFELREGGEEEKGSRYESKWPRIGSMNSRNGSIRALPFAHRFPREPGYCRFYARRNNDRPRIRPALINCERSSKRARGGNYRSSIALPSIHAIVSFFFIYFFLFHETKLPYVIFEDQDLLEECESDVKN